MTLVMGVLCVSVFGGKCVGDFILRLQTLAPHCKTGFCKLSTEQELLMGEGGWKHTVLRGNSPFIVPVDLPEGTRVLGLPVSSHTHWLRGG